MPLVRLQKYISDCGIMSRRSAEKEIEAGRVTVNGSVAVTGQKVDPETDTVCIDGKKISYGTSSSDGKKYIYVLLNKPVGYVTSMSDDKGRLTVCDLVRSVGTRIYPVGRLDMYSDGLIIMTNDGDFTNAVTHPKGNVTKTYVAEIVGNVSEEDVMKMSARIEIDGYLINAPVVEYIGRGNDCGYDVTSVRFVLSEGRNREIRKICKHYGYKIKKLTRTAIGDITSDGLKTGSWRYLSSREVEDLRRKTEEI